LTIQYEARDRIATITIDRPDVKNALGPVEWRAIAEATARAGDDRDVRALIVTGAGGVFSAGGDLKSMPERLAMPTEARRAQLLGDAQAIALLRGLAKPTVAMIDGAAVGAGLSLALACDVRIASSTARLGAVFHKVGLTGDFGLLWLLPRVVGPARAIDLLYAAEILDAARAEAIGLVTRVVAPERLLDETRAYAARLADGPPLALAMTKRGLQLGLERGLAEMLAWEAEAQAICSRSDDAREGVTAFFEKRKPRFTGG
jgi:2-(1,2-epoxy-1,2-dihydrophenyl)acetyl-CoA isomerase